MMIPHSLRQLCLLGLLILSLSSQALPPEKLNHDINALSKHYLKNHTTPGIGIALLYQKKIHYFFYGQRHLASHEKFDKQTVFNAMGIRPILSATLLGLDLVRKQLTLNESIGTFYQKDPKPLPTSLAQLTFKQLASQTSGLPPLPRSNKQGKTAHGLAWLRTHPWQPSYLPGTRWSASPLNFQLLANALARKHASRYNEWLASQLFTPLKMQRSFAELPSSPLTNMSQSYQQRPNLSADAPSETRPAFKPIPLKQKAIYTDLEDLSKLIQINLLLTGSRELRQASRLCQAPLFTVGDQFNQALAWKSYSIHQLYLASLNDPDANHEAEPIVPFHLRQIKVNVFQGSEQGSTILLLLIPRLNIGLALVANSDTPLLSLATDLAITLVQ